MNDNFGIDMQNIDSYISHIKAQYAAFYNGRMDDIAKRMIAEFEVTYEPGNKYLKVITGRDSRSVHSFVCMKDNGKFKKGDILKAASWAAPAKNFARGNVIAGNFENISWTGA